MLLRYKRPDLIPTQSDEDILARDSSVLVKTMADSDVVRSNPCTSGFISGGIDPSTSVKNSLEADRLPQRLRKK